MNKVVILSCIITSVILPIQGYQRLQLTASSPSRSKAPASPTRPSSTSLIPKKPKSTASPTRSPTSPKKPTSTPSSLRKPTTSASTSNKSKQLPPLGQPKKSTSIPTASPSSSRKPLTSKSSSTSEAKQILLGQTYETLLPPRNKPTSLVLADKKGGIYVFEQPFVLGVIDVKNRMSILRLSDGTFAIHSPLAPTEECVSMVKDLIKKERLKQASWLIVPNAYPEHHEFLKGWREIFPEARVLSATIRISVIAEYLLPDEDAFPEALREDLDVAMLKTPLLQEALIYHKASKSLLVADSGFYINDQYANSLTRFITKLQGIYNRFATPPFFRLGTDIEQGRKTYKKVQSWAFDRIVTCHAALVTEKAKEAFVEGYSHLK